MGNLRKLTNTSLRNIDKDFEKDFSSISKLRRSLANITQNRSADDSLNLERNNHNSFEPKFPPFNDELTESPMNFLINMENYLRVVNVDQYDLIYPIEACPGSNYKAWFDAVKDRIANENFSACIGMWGPGMHRGPRQARLEQGACSCAPTQSATLRSA